MMRTDAVINRTRRVSIPGAPAVSTLVRCLQNVITGRRCMPT